MSFDPQVFESVTRDSADALAKAAQAVPEDKRLWNPGGSATNVVGIVHHCAEFPKWMMRAAEVGGYPHDYEETNASGDLQSEIDALKQNTEELIAWGKGLSPERLAAPLSFPWAPDATLGQMLMWHEWNNTYHLGQVNYVQLLYGDAEMHM
jgi:uncharacterized damage-inducible protein DinB